MRNRGIARGRIFFGELLLVAAVMTWATALLMSPHDSGAVEGTQHVRAVVTTFLRNTAVGTLLLSAIAGWMLFPARRPRKPWRDYAVGGLLVILAASSVYQLIWVQSLT